MKISSLSAMAILLILAGYISSALAQDASPFDAYKIILDRNIFDSTRSPRPKPTERRQQEVRPDRIKLSGVFIRGRESVAFFEGTRSEFNRSVRLRQKIAGHELAEIKTTRVKLVRNGKVLELPVNSQIERLGDKEWTISTSTSPVNASAANSGARRDENKRENRPNRNAAEDGNSRNQRGDEEDRGPKEEGNNQDSQDGREDTEGQEDGKEAQGNPEGRETQNNQENEDQEAGKESGENQDSEQEDQEDRQDEDEKEDQEVNENQEEEKTSDAPTETDGASDDLIKRLMERRKKEMGQ